MTSTLERKRNQQLEAQMQDAVVQHLELRAVPGLVFFHVPNGSKLGGARTRSGIPLAAIRMKRHGLRKGVSDLVFLRPDGVFFALELKAKGKRPTEEQHQFMGDVIEAHGYAAWTDSLDRALEILEAWQLIRPNIHSMSLTEQEKWPAA
jgi:hypothetical protein